MLKAGKGLRITATEPGVVAGLQKAMFEVEDAFEYEEPIEGLVSEYGWNISKDPFGTKATTTIKMGSNEIRVALIFSKGEYKLDIREWYQD